MSKKVMKAIKDVAIAATVYTSFLLVIAVVIYTVVPVAADSLYNDNGGVIWISTN